MSKVPWKKQIAKNLSPEARLASELDEALDFRLEFWNINPAIADDAEQQKAIAYIESAVGSYKIALEDVSKVKLSLHDQVKFVSKMLFDRLDAKVAATLRGTNGSRKTAPTASPIDVLEWAEALDVMAPLYEVVRLHWAPKSDGTFRPIWAYGPKRKSQAIMVRDMLVMCGFESKHQYAKKGGGGERAMTQAISSEIIGGKNWWWTPDIKSAFPSMLPGHFGWMGLDKRVIRNVIYLPMCAVIKMKLPTDVKAFKAFIAGVIPVNGLAISFKVRAITLARRGLPQGSVLSPLMAGALIEHLWAINVPSTEIFMSHWHDDFAVGGKQEAAVTAVKESFSKALASLPAGAIFFHKCPLRQADKHGVVFLGYRFQPGRGHKTLPDGRRTVHVLPAKKRFKRFNDRLAQRLDACDEADKLEKGIKYHSQWYGAQLGWTKVPERSYSLSRFIAETNIGWHLKGMEMDH